MIKKMLLLVLVLQFTACDTLNQIAGDFLEEGGISNAEVAKGLKQALEFGIIEGAQKLSKENGYYQSPYKILLPAEARKVTDKLQNIPGFSNLEEVILEKINRGAEDAAKKAAPIFKDAITSMTFSDAMNILMGNNDAATNYLNKATYNSLYKEFNPVIVSSLDKFNARDYWADAVNAYNKLPFVDQVNPDLDDHVTTMALVGLFDMIEKKELDIRTNLSARTTDLLRKVFAKQD
ncbi:MAG: DUF4197 domain-containing protein [Bacteroidetes bacterium]|nr:DUF4197 domain-containing protein [Bacteroidota bacterium]